MIIFTLPVQRQLAQQFFERGADNRPLFTKEYALDIVQLLLKARGLSYETGTVIPQYTLSGPKAP